MRSTICRAIGNQRIIEFEYDSYNRVVEPHKVGKTTRGTVVLSGYQTAGSGDRVDPPGWGLYRLENIGALNVTDRGFSGPRSQYSSTDQRMTEIYCQL
jgi:hypothetical protein